jgi:hypothetical protein
MRIGRRLALAILSALAGGPAFAGTGSPTLAPGETRVIHTGLVYRDIKLCNESESQGDLLAVIGSNEAIRLAPGMCAWQPGDSMTLRNESAGLVLLTYRVSTCSEPRGH